jgi:hypothetical protein
MRDVQITDQQDELGKALIEASKALFADCAASFTDEVRDGARSALAQGAALELRLQLRPTVVLRAVLENLDGTEHELFALVPTVAISTKMM